MVVAEAGIPNASEPSLGVLSVKTVGKVKPPSVLREIFTLAQLTGEAVVLATFQVMFWVEPPAHVTLLLGAVTTNGPDVLLTVTTASVKAVCPTAIGATELNARLSLTVTLKFNVRLTELSASMFVAASPPGNGPVTFKPANMVESLGKVLVPVAVAGNVNQFGPVALVGEATLPVPVVVELSFCSQQ